MENNKQYWSGVVRGGVSEDAINSEHMLFIELAWKYYIRWPEALP